jgi:hypothetical protein
LTVTFPASPLDVPASPPRLGVRLLIVPLGAAVKVTTGGVVSTVNVIVLLESTVTPSDASCEAKAV